MISAAQRIDVPTEVRVGLIEDFRFVADSWAKSLRPIGYNYLAFDWFPRKLRDIQAHLERSTVLVAHLDGEPSEIVSYLVYTRVRDIFVAHFAYTKDNARRQGIVRELLAVANAEQLPVAFTQPAKNEETMRHFAGKFVFDPDLWSQS